MKKRNKYYENFVRTGEIPLKDSKRETVMQWLYDSHLVEWYVTYLMKKSMKDDFVQDVVQEMWVQIGEVPQAQWDELFRQGYYAVSSYVTGIIHRQVYSGNSKIYYKYYRYNNTEFNRNYLFWQNIDENNEEEKFEI